jgi:hypothetical protein
MTWTLQLHFASYLGNNTLSSPEFSVLVVVAILMSRAVAGLDTPNVNPQTIAKNSNMARSIEISLTF